MFDLSEFQELSPLPHRLHIDRLSSATEIASNFYPHADRDLNLYKEMVPCLHDLLTGLTQTKKEVKALDVGCGTGRAAAELMDAYPGVDMRGITLIFHPPVASHKYLPRSRIKICHAGKTGFPERSFDFIIAVGSLDTSDTIFEEGRAVLRLVNQGGIFILAPTTHWFLKQEIEKLKNHALENWFFYSQYTNDYGLPNFIFKRKD